MFLAFVGNNSECCYESKQANEQKTVKLGKLSLPNDRRNITEYLRRETWIVLCNFLYFPFFFFIQIKVNQLEGLPAMCQITSVDLILAMLVLRIWSWIN